MQLLAASGINGCPGLPRNAKPPATPFGAQFPRTTTKEASSPASNCRQFAMLSRQALLRAARAAGPQRVAVASASHARFYATPSAGDTVKPPVAVFGLDGTYATALVRQKMGEEGVQMVFLFLGQEMARPNSSLKGEGIAC